MSQKLCFDLYDDINDVCSGEYFPVSSDTLCCPDRGAGASYDPATDECTDCEGKIISNY